jgi:hypothetical protein
MVGRGVRNEEERPGGEPSCEIEKGGVAIGERGGAGAGTGIGRRQEAKRAMRAGINGGVVEAGAEETVMPTMAETVGVVTRNVGREGRGEVKGAGEMAKKKRAKSC